MIRLACIQAHGWLSARRAGLSQASALRLEEHLTGCADCGTQARLLDGLRKLSDRRAQPLDPSARHRAVLQAFARAERPSQPSAARPVWLVPSAFGALAGVAALALALFVNRLPSGDRVLAGELEVAGRALPRGAALESDSELSTHDGARVALAHATLELRPGTQARWHGDTRELRLERGTVAADVDPTRHQSFSVATAAFRVLVLGTSFEVSPERVRVMRGRVRVVSESGEALATLDAGQHWELAPPGSQPTAAPEPAPAALQPTAAREPVWEGSRLMGATLPDDHRSPALRAGSPAAVRPAAVPEPRAPAHKPRGAVRREPEPRVQPQAVQPAPDFDAQLELARQALGRRELPRAHGLLETALAAQLQPKQRAEALTLSAECALVAGDLRGAEAGYARVAEQFASLPAGENAAFAVARLMADRRSEDGLVRYLAHYPQGRFVKEANARLHQLRGVTPSP